MSYAICRYLDSLPKRAPKRASDPYETQADIDTARQFAQWLYKNPGCWPSPFAGEEQRKLYNWQYKYAKRSARIAARVKKLHRHGYTGPLTSFL